MTLTPADHSEIARKTALEMVRLLPEAYPEVFEADFEITRVEAQEKLGCSYATVSNYIKNGQLTPRGGRYQMFSNKQVMALKKALGRK
jgi:hypothetical protein